MSLSAPRVSVGLPVFNGERFLATTIEAILSQTFQDFELVISDNASTDATQAIATSYAGRDPRVRYFRNDQNLGAVRNFNRVFHLARGEYFKWAAYDDLIAPEFLERCAEALDRHPLAVLAYTKTRFIDERGNVLKDYDVQMRLESPTPEIRFHDFVCQNHWPFQLFGLIRSSVLRTVPLLGSYVGSDRNFLAELILVGPFHKVDDYLFSYREHSQTSTALYPDFRTRMAWWDPSRAGAIAFPVWRRLYEYLVTIHRVRLTTRERIIAYGVLVKWLVGSRWMSGRWRLLARDLQVAAQRITARAVLAARRIRSGRQLAGS